MPSPTATGLIMLYDGRIVVDIAGEEKKKLTVEQLLALFSKASGSDEADDKLLLSDLLFMIPQSYQQSESSETSPEVSPFCAPLSMQIYIVI